MRLTIAVPTIGRPTLVDTLESIKRQALLPGDRVLIVYDSFQRTSNADATRELVSRYGFTFVEHDGGYHFYGNPQLNRAMELATGDYFCALGDDDVYVDGAIARLRRQLSDRAVLFQFYTPPDMVPNKPGLRLKLWADRTLRAANISGCCIAAPRLALVPVKADRRIEVDYEWIVDIVAKTGKPIKWMRDCLIIARPERGYHQGVSECPSCGFVGFTEDFDGSLCGDCAPTVIRELLEASA